MHHHFYFIPEVSFATCYVVYVRHPTASRLLRSSYIIQYDADGEVVRLAWEVGNGIPKCDIGTVSAWSVMQTVCRSSWSAADDLERHTHVPHSLLRIIVSFVSVTVSGLQEVR